MLVLASASPRRAELLRQIGLSFEIRPVEIDESVLPDELPEEYVLRLAEEKSRAALGEFSTGPVLGSDTAVVAGDEIFGKPTDYSDFLKMMKVLSGARHKVMSSVAVLDSQRVKTAISVTDVHFRKLSDTDIENYWHTGEPLDKAGGYAIQGIAAAFIERIDGSYSGVMGLPLYETAEILSDFGMLPNLQR